MKQNENIINLKEAFERTPRKRRDAMYQQIADDYGYDLFPRGAGQENDKSTMTVPACKVPSSTMTLMKAIVEKSNGEFMHLSQLASVIMTFGAGVAYKRFCDPDGVFVKSAYESYLEELNTKENSIALNYINNQLDNLERLRDNELLDEKQYAHGKLMLFKIYKDNKVLVNILKKRMGTEYAGKTWEEWLEEEI